MKVLIGTTNPAKVESFKKQFIDYEIEFITLNDLEIKTEPKEVGNTPVENAIIKAKYYGKYFEYVICNDSGLYFENISFDDKRQPGLNVRNINGKRLNDEEMISYYSSLAHEFSGNLIAYYLDGFAVYAKGKMHSFMETDQAKVWSFIICEKPHFKIVPGWPIDSLSKNKKTNNYYFDETEYLETDEEKEIKSKYRQRMNDFFVESLGLKTK